MTWDGCDALQYQEFPGLTYEIGAAPKLSISRASQEWGGYSFRRFSFGERGSYVPSKVIREISDGMTKRIVANGDAPDTILSPEPGGHMWGAILAARLGCSLAVLRLPDPEIPSASDRTIARQSAYRTAQLESVGLDGSGRIVVVDDVLSGGGTMRAILKECQRQHANVIGAYVIVSKHPSGEPHIDILGIRVTALQMCSDG